MSPREGGLRSRGLPPGAVVLKPIRSAPHLGCLGMVTAAGGGAVVVLVLVIAGALPIGRLGVALMLTGFACFFSVVDRWLLLLVPHAIADGTMWRQRLLGGWSDPVDVRQIIGVAAMEGGGHGYNGYSLTGFRVSGGASRRAVAERPLVDWFGPIDGSSLHHRGVEMVRLGAPIHLDPRYLQFLQSTLPSDAVLNEAARHHLRR